MADLRHVTGPEPHSDGERSLRGFLHQRLLSMAWKAWKPPKDAPWPLDTAEYRRENEPPAVEPCPPRPKVVPPKTGWDALSDSDKAEWTAMVAEMRDPETKACGCGYPKTECLRVVLRNGPPYPERPCEPEPTSG